MVHSGYDTLVHTSTAVRLDLTLLTFTSTIQLHNTLAGSRVCDHLHDGLGFLPQHAAFTLMFEKVHA